MKEISAGDRRLLIEDVIWPNEWHNPFEKRSVTSHYE